MEKNKLEIKEEDGYIFWKENLNCKRGNCICSWLCMEKDLVISLLKQLKKYL